MSATDAALPDLYDVARLCREMGISRRAAEQILRQVPKQRVDGMRKAWARGADIRAYLDSRVERP